MKKNKKITAAIILFFTLPLFSNAQDSSKNDLNFNIAYYMSNNNVVYLIAKAKTKIKGKFQAVKDIPVSFFLDSDSAGNLISKSITNDQGLAKAVLTPNLKAIWDASPKHIFKAATEATKDYDATTADVSMVKSKITLDTSSDGDTKTITVKVSSFDGTNWHPEKGVEMKLGVENKEGTAILSATDDASFTTDSLGTVTAELKKANLPGDEKGNLILAAKVEDNEQLGNLKIEQTVPWGVVEKTDNSFFKQRTLWSTRFRTPWWLLAMAYSIVFGVWGIIIYLIRLMIKIKKIGVMEQN